MEDIQLILKSTKELTIKELKEKARLERPSPSEVEILLKAALTGHDSWIMAIDQSYDSTGFALIIPDIKKINRKAFAYFLTEVFPCYETRIVSDIEQVKKKFNSALVNNGGSLIFEPSSQVKPFPFGAIIGENLQKDYSGAKNCVILHGMIKNLPSDDPEWLIVQNIANRLVSLAKEFKKLMPEEAKLNIYMEGLALAGNALTARNLPLFGGLYFEIFRQFCSDEIGNFFAEMPISTWKSILFGTTRGIEKQFTQKYLLRFGLGPFKKSEDDDTDALAILMVGLLECSEGLMLSKLNRGRIRPTGDQRVANMALRKEKKERKVERAKKLEENKILKAQKELEKKERAKNKAEKTKKATKPKTKKSKK